MTDHLCTATDGRRGMTTPFACQSCGPTHREHVARGLCSRCYAHHRDHGTLDAYPPVRTATVRPPHACTTHPAGTRACYDNDACRCTRCARAKYRYEALRELDPAPRLVPSAGARRRLQGLAWAGWPQAWVSERAGLKPGTLNAAARRDTVSRTTHDRIARLTRELAEQTPQPTTRGERIAVTRTRNLARTNGWAPLAAWDDGTGPHGIDNPDATPTGVRDHEPTYNTDAAPDVEHLLEAGESPEQIARALGIAHPSLLVNLRRTGRHDLAERLYRKAA